MALFTEKEMRPSKKSTQSLQLKMVEVQRGFAASGTGCLDCVNSIMKSDDYQRIFGAQHSGQCQNAASPPEVIGLPAGQ